MSLFALQILTPLTHQECKNKVIQSALQSCRQHNHNNNLSLHNLGSQDNW